MLDDGRIAIAALALGLPGPAWTMSVDYAVERTTSAGRSARKQGVAFPIADLT